VTLAITLRYRLNENGARAQIGCGTKSAPPTRISWRAFHARFTRGGYSSHSIGYRATPLPEFDPPIIVSALSGLSLGSIVRWDGDQYGFCAGADDDPSNRWLVLHNTDGGKFEYVGNPPDTVIAYDKESLVIRPSIDSFRSILRPSAGSTGELYIRDGLPLVVVQTGDDSLALLNLDSGMIEGLDTEDQAPMSGFTAWSLGVWQSDGDFLALIEIDVEYGDGE
jgi:hypothetical protein